MPKKKDFTINEKNIPTIIEAVEKFGGLSKNSTKAVELLETLLYFKEDNSNKVHLKVETMGDTLESTPSNIRGRIGILRKYDFIKDVTKDVLGDVGESSVWEINIDKIESSVKKALIAKRIKDRKGKNQKE